MMKGLILICLVFVTFSVVTSTPYVVNYEEPTENEVEVDVTTARPLFGTKMCTRGPAYWCHNITQAKECGAVKHCIGRVWEHMKLPEDNDDVCDICKDMVKQARDQLLSNETQDELRQVLEGSCKLIPLKIVSDECSKLADEFIPELIDALVSRMDPQAVCAVSGLCNSIRIDEMLGQMKEIEERKASDSFDIMEDSCPKCSHYVGKFVDTIKNLTKDQLLHKIFEVCGHLGSYSDACRATAMDNIDSIYDYVQNELSPVEACGVIGLCEVVSFNPVKVEGSPNGVQALRPPLTDYQCDFCKQLVSYMKQWFTSDTTKEEFKEIITGLCKQTGKYAQECLKMANEYGDLVYNLIVEELDPVNFCIFIEQCNQTSSIAGRVKLFSSASNPAPLWTILHSDASLTKLEPAQKWTGDDERPSHQPGFTYPMTKLQPAEKLTGDDEQLVWEYPMVKLTPAEKMTGASVVAKKGVSDILPTCGICTFTVGKIFELLAGKNRTQETIDHAMERVCYVIPTHYKEECLTFMKEYGDKVAEMILIDGTAHGICTAIGLCLLGSPVPTQNTPNVPLVVEAGLPFDRYMPQVMANDELEKMEPVDKKPSCPLCEFVISRLDSMLTDNATEVEIRESVEVVCKWVPRTLRHSCRDFIKQYGETVINYFSHNVEPKRICTKLKLCNGRLELDSDSSEEELAMDLTNMNRGEQVMVNDELERIDPVDEKPSCPLCEFVITRLDSMLTDNATEEEIKETVEQVCKWVPRTLRTSCRDFIEQYGDTVINYLTHQMEPRRICTELKLCNGGLELDSDSSEEEFAMDLTNMNRCELCELIASYLSAFLDDPTVDTSIEKLVEKVCPLLPRNHEKDCKELIEDYGPYLLSLLAQATDKGKACAAVNLCPATP